MDKRLSVRFLLHSLLLYTFCLSVIFSPLCWLSLSFLFFLFCRPPMPTPQQNVNHEVHNRLGMFAHRCVNYSHPISPFTFHVLFGRRVNWGKKLVLKGLLQENHLLFPVPHTGNKSFETYLSNPGARLLDTIKRKFPKQKRWFFFSFAVRLAEAESEGGKYNPQDL